MEDPADDFNAFFDMAYGLAEGLRMPMPAFWMGDPVSLTAIDPIESSLCQGIKGILAEETKPIPLAELSFKTIEPANISLIARYNRWRKSQEA